jgi:CMP-N,N'-diacetyllegionaminic acid synthase
MPILFIIPARGGSKGIPGKNIRPLAGKPLIYYAIDVAREVANPEDIICVSTDDEAIIEKVTSYGLDVPFKRPEELATDEAGMNEVIVHTLNYYEEKGKIIDKIVLLQPTSPLRTSKQVKEAIESFDYDSDMLVSVKITDANPYYVLAEENSEGYLVKSKEAKFTRRQDCPVVYQYNGAIYVINPKSLKVAKLSEFKKLKKYVMDANSSVDIDTPLDWAFAEFLINRNER